MKKCPSCDSALVELKLEEVVVDTCSNGCGGAWFDRNELKKFDEKHETDAEKIILQVKDSTGRNKESKMKSCPVCPEEVLVRRSYDIMDMVEVDQCFKCSGIWLDKGELETIRSQFETEADRNKAGDEYLDSALGKTKEELSNYTQQKIAEELRKYGSRKQAVETFFKSFLG